MDDPDAIAVLGLLVAEGLDRHRESTVSVTVGFLRDLLELIRPRPVKARKIPIEDQVQAAKRELSFRQRVYPNWIAKKRVSREEAGRQLVAMEAIIETLEEVAAGERLI